MNGLDSASNEGEFALRHYVSALWRRKILIIAVAVLGAIVGIAAGQGGSRSFTSTVQILFQPREAEQIFAPADGGSSSSGRNDPLSTEIAVMQSRSVRDPVRDAIGEPIQVSITPLTGTEVVALTATARQRERAETVAQTYAETFIEIRLEQLVSDLLKAIETVQAEVTTLEAQLAELDAPLKEIDDKLLKATDENQRRALENERADIVAQRQPLLTRKGAFDEEIDQLRLARNLTATGGAQIISDATPARATARGEGRRNAAAGLALGLVLGVILAFVREHFDETVKGLDDLEASVAPMPILAVIPHLRRRWPWWRRDPGDRLVARSSPGSAGADAFRGLWTGLELVSDGIRQGGARTLHVASPGESDGRTTATANLAVIVARTGQRVIVVDGNLRRPALHRYLSVANEGGLSEVLVDGADPLASLRDVPDTPGLRILTAGSALTEGLAVLSPSRVRSLLSALRPEADVVLVDGPPVLGVADSVMYASAVDASVLLARVRHSRNPEVARATDVLHQVKAGLVGAALNEASRRDTGQRTFASGWLSPIERFRVARARARTGRPAVMPPPEGPTETVPTTTERSSSTPSTTEPEHSTTL